MVCSVVWLILTPAIFRSLGRSLHDNSRLTAFNITLHARPNSTLTAMSEISPFKSLPSRSSTLKDKKVTGNALVHRIQSLRLPIYDVPLITNLDNVVFGTMAASETVLICNIKPPQYLWYMVSGGICDILQFIMDFLLHYWVEDASICWAVCFTISIIFRHSTHRYLVFGNYVGGYWKSLLRMYCGYSISIIVSTIFNVFVTRTASIGHYPAFVFTLLWTGIVNFFILKKLWSFNGGKTAKSSPRADVELAFEDRLTR